MKKSKIIAISALSSGFIVILLTVGAYFPTFDLSCLFMASLVTMLPLSKNSYPGATLAVIASSILSLFVSGFRFQIVLPFFLFFGFHPLVNHLAQKKKFNKWITLAVKDVWFVLTLLLMQFLSEIIAIDIESIERFIYPILIVGGALAFFVYDWFMLRFQTYTDLLIKRLKL